MQPATDSRATNSSSAARKPSDSDGSKPSRTEPDGELASSPPGFWRRETRFEDFSIQDFLSLGYLYLLCVGIMTEVIYYKMIGINILYYAGVTDVLLSPIIFVTRRLTILLVLAALLIAIGVLDHFKRKQARRCAAEPRPDGKPAPQHPRDFFVKMTAFTVFFMFIGGGTGAGVAQANRLATGDFECQDAIEFFDGTVQNVRIMGQNSGFVFYAIPGQKSPIIAPIDGNIRRIFTATQDIPTDRSAETPDKDKPIADSPAEPGAPEAEL